MGVLAATGKLLARLVPAGRPGSISWPWLGRFHAPRITSSYAMSLAAVWACNRYLTGNIGQLPWRVYKRGNGKSEELSDHKAYWLLSVRANPELSAFNFRTLMLYRALMLGNGYAEIERDAANRPVALWPIENDRVTPDRNEAGDLIYRITNSGRDEVIIQAKDMFHLIGLSEDGIVGMAVITYAARSIGLGIAQETYGYSFFQNSGVPSGVLEHPKNLSEPAAERLRKQFDEKYAGEHKSQYTLVLEEGMKYAAVGLPPEQAQFLASRQHSVEEISRWFGVPPQKIQQLLHSSYASMEQLSIEVITDTLMPWVKKFEQEADYKLLSDSWGGIYTRMDLRGLMRGTHADRAAYYRAMFGIGALSINEIRDKEDLNPIKNGDLHLIPLNMAPLDMVADGSLLKPQVQGPNPAEPTGTPLPKEDASKRKLLNFLEDTLDELAAREGRAPQTYIIGPRDVN